MGGLVFLGQLLGLEKTLAHLAEDLNPGAEKVAGYLGPSRPGHERQHRWRGAPVDHLKGRGAQGGVIGSVVAVLRPRQPIHPSTGTINCQIHSNHLVNHLGLAV